MPPRVYFYTLVFATRLFMYKYIPRVTPNLPLRSADAVGPGYLYCGRDTLLALQVPVVEDNAQVQTIYPK